MASATIVVASLAWIRLGPLDDRLLDLRDAQSIEVVDRHGDLLYEARSGDGSRGSAIDADRLPPTLVDATIAAEDRRFFQHPGVDPLALLRAAARDLRSRRAVEGGSTITQQTAKLLLARLEHQTRRRGMAAKLRETIVALRLEHHVTKRQILALYLTLAPYGNNVTGAARASQSYFGQPASLLTPAQAAFLAGLPQRPTSFNPYRDLPRAQARQRQVIARMLAIGRLTPDRAREALAEQLALEREPAVFLAPHFVQRVLASDPGRGRIQTTLDAALQRDIAGIIRAARPSLERHGARNVAVVVLDNATGEWLAWEGSGDYGDAAHGGAIDGVTAPRQPGSALKPFTYALGFEEGESPASVLADVQSFFPTAQEGVLYSPRNYDGRFRGPLLARRALAGSENVPAVAMASRVGVPSLLRFLRSAGFTTFDRNAAVYGLGLTLGDAEVRLDELVAAYAAFARGGTFIAPTMIRGGPVASARGLVSTRTAFWITDILSDPDARAYAFGRGGSLEFPFAVAAKTGTSQAYHDNWTVGYTKTVTVGVWVGNFDRRPLVGSSGVTGAGPIFHDVMLAAAQHAATGADALATAPPGTSRRRICALSGLEATDQCPRVIEEWTADEMRPTPCYWHRGVDSRVVVDWPPEFRQWVSVNPSTGSGQAPPTNSAQRAPSARSVSAALQVVTPPNGAVYLIDPTLRREFQTVPLRAVGAERDPIEWRVDDIVVGSSSASEAVDWPLAVGRHVVSARTARGSAESSIVVK